MKRVRTVTTLQMESAECGAASLAMILGHHGRHVPLEELRTACDVGRDGSRASNVLKAARGYGMAATGVQVETSDLADLPLPAVLFWNFNHFVVYEGTSRRFGRSAAHLNDPAKGRRAVSREEFDTSFTGLVLTFEPGVDFEPGGNRPSTLRGLLDRVRQVRVAMVIVLIASLLLIFVGLMIPAMSRAFVDLFLVEGYSSLLSPFFLITGAAVALVLVLTALQQTFLRRAQLFSSTARSAQFLHHALRLPVSFFSQRSPADIALRLASNDQVAEILCRTSSAAITSGLIVVLYAALLWSYDSRLTVIGVLIALINIGLVRAISSVRRGAVAKVRVDEAKLQSVSYSGLQLVETMKSVGGEEEFFRRWASQHAQLLNGQQRAQAPTVLLTAAAPMLGMLNATMILWIGGLRAVEGGLSIGVLIAFQALIRNFTAPVGELAEVGPQVQDLGADIARLRDVDTAAEDPSFSRADSAITHRLSGSCAVRDVTFGYSRLSRPLIDKLSFVVGPGQQVALVGGSGSGKSTVTGLISGLREPWSGEIWFGEHRQREIPRNVLAASVAFVDQDIFLFEGTVRDNVTLWNPSISDAAVLSALHDACIHDVIAGRPGGIHGRVEQDGRNFSGGQRQRLEIARALAQSASIIVLDEATSALDAETEETVYTNLRRRGCALIVIAHRLSTVRDSDEILVLDGGRVIERGTHDALLAGGGAYASMAKGASQ